MVTPILSVLTSGYHSNTNSLPSGSYEDCSLATYTITIPNGGVEVELKPGPYINIDGVEVLSPKSKLQNALDVLTWCVTLWLPW